MTGAELIWQLLEGNLESVSKEEFEMSNKLQEMVSRQAWCVFMKLEEIHNNRSIHDVEQAYRLGARHGSAGSFDAFLGLLDADAGACNG